LRFFADTVVPALMAGCLMREHGNPDKGSLNCQYCGDGGLFHSRLLQLMAHLVAQGTFACSTSALFVTTRFDRDAFFAAQYI